MDFLIIDSRYCVLYDGDYFIESRLAISYGRNVTIEMNKEVCYEVCDAMGNVVDTFRGRPFLTPSLQHGDFVFGLHVICVNPLDEKVQIVDGWITSYAAKGDEGKEEIIKKARLLFGEISEEDYKWLNAGDDLEIRNIGMRPMKTPQYIQGLLCNDF